MFVGQGAEAVGFDEEGPSGFDGESGKSGRGPGFEGQGADNRDIEAEILVRFGNLYRDGLAASEGGAALDRLIGALESFHGEDGAIADYDGLADIEATDFFGDAKTERDIIIGPAPRGWSGKMSYGGEKFLEERGCGKKFDARFGELIGDRTKKCLGIAFLEFGQHEKRGEVGAEVEEIFRGNLSGHDGLTGAGLFRVGDEFAELSDPQPPEVVDQAGQCRIGFVLEGGGAKALYPPSARGLGELEWIASIPGDDEKRFGRAQRAGFSGRRCSLSRR